MSVSSMEMHPRIPQIIVQTLDEFMARELSRKKEK